MGAIGWPVKQITSSLSDLVHGRTLISISSLLGITISTSLVEARPCGFPFEGNPGVKIVTWLILPVVICLSQRLSHVSLILLHSRKSKLTYSL